jgi:glycerol-3-phosphate dehydrogenase (NAD(P)+)
VTRVHVLGAGAFGRALATALAGTGATLHAREARPDLRDGDIALLVVPAAQTADALAAWPLPPGAVAVACAKGLVAGHLQSQIIAARHPGPVAVLTGPGFADEIAQGLPTALTLACADDATGAALQAQLSTRSLRLYRTDDIVGAQVGGALKNVTAIACGAAVGAGLGESARAALMTRGFAEMVRMGLALGGQERTFAGLSGLGDLALTCTSARSRNFAAGLALGQGQPLPPGVTTEGVGTAQTVLDLSARHGIDMPIAAAVAALVTGRMDVRQVMAGLLARPLRPE